MGFSDYAGDLLGFQMGGVRDPYHPSGAYDKGAEALLNKNLMALYSKVFDAINSGNLSHFMDPMFHDELESVLVPLRASYASNRTRTMQNISQSGIHDPVALQRLLEDQDRMYGSNVAAAGRDISTQKMGFLRTLIGSAQQYSETQQQGISGEHNTELAYDAARKAEQDARTKQQMGVLRQYMMMGAGGMGGGMMGGMGGGGGGAGGFGGGEFGPGDITGGCG